MIQQHVEAQDLEAGAAAGVAGEAGVVIMLEDGVSGDQRLDDHVLNVIPHLVRVAADGLQVLVQGGQLPGGQTQTTVTVGFYGRPGFGPRAHRLLPVFMSQTKFSLFLLME